MKKLLWWSTSILTILTAVIFWNYEYVYFSEISTTTDGRYLALTAASYSCGDPIILLDRKTNERVVFSPMSGGSLRDPVLSDKALYYLEVNYSDLRSWLVSYDIGKKQLKVIDQGLGEWRDLTLAPDGTALAMIRSKMLGSIERPSPVEISVILLPSLERTVLWEGAAQNLVGLHYATRDELGVTGDLQPGGRPSAFARPWPTWYFRIEPDGTLIREEEISFASYKIRIDDDAELHFNTQVYSDAKYESSHVSRSILRDATKLSFYLSSDRNSAVFLYGTDFRVTMSYPAPPARIRAMRYDFSDGEASSIDLPDVPLYLNFCALLR